MEGWGKDEEDGKKRGRNRRRRVVCGTDSYSVGGCRMEELREERRRGGVMHRGEDESLLCTS